MAQLSQSSHPAHTQTRDLLHEVSASCFPFSHTLPLTAPFPLVMAMAQETVRGQIFEVGPRYTSLQYIGEGAYGMVV